MRQKFFISFVIILCIICIGLFVNATFNNLDLRERNETLNKHLREADLLVGKAHTELKNANNQVSLLSEQLQREVKDLKATVTMYASLEAKYNILKTQKGKVQIEYYPGEPIEVPCPETEFVRGLLYEALTDKSLAPIQKLSTMARDERLDVTCSVEPKPNTNRQIPMTITYRLHFRLRGQLIETRASSGAINHFVDLREIDENGKDIGQFELAKFEVIRTDETSPHFIWWTPHIDVGVPIGWNNSRGFTSGGAIGFTPMGYGRTTNDLTWRFPQVSLDVIEIPGIGFSPFVYNVGAPLPLVSNIWIGPHVTWMLDQAAFMGIWVGGVL